MRWGSTIRSWGIDRGGRRGSYPGDRKTDLRIPTPQQLAHVFAGGREVLLFPSPFGGSPPAHERGGFLFVVDRPVAVAELVRADEVHPFADRGIVDRTVAGGLAGAPFGDEECDTGVQGLRGFVAQLLLVGAGVEMERVGDVRILDRIGRGEVDILRPNRGADNDQVVGIDGANRGDDLLGVRLDVAAPRDLFGL